MLIHNFIECFANKYENNFGVSQYPKVLAKMVIYIITLIRIPNVLVTISNLVRVIIKVKAK